MSFLRIKDGINLGSLAADPGTAQKGDIYFNTSTNKLKQYNGTAWENIASEGYVTTQLGSYVPTSEKGAANGVATLGADGKLTNGQIPAIAITDTFVVASEVAMLALTAQTGDVAVRTDLNKSFILAANDPTVLANWQELLSPASPVLSVNGQTGAVTLVTDDIAEDGSPVNLWFTDARAKAAAVADSITDGITDVAPSQNAVFDALALKLANVVEDTTPQLGGDLDVNNKAIEDAANPILIAPTSSVRRATQAAKANFVEEQYIHSTTLLASQTDAVIAALTFAHATYQGIEISYSMKEATSNNVRIGTLRIVSNGTAVAVNDMFADTADLGVSFSAAVNGANVEVKYTSDTNDCTARMDVKKFLV